MLLLKREMCDNKKSKFVKKRSKGTLLNSLGLKTSLSKFQLLGNILFKRYKMNEIVEKLWLVGDNFMPKMHLRQPGFTYSASGAFIKQKK